MMRVDGLGLDLPGDVAALGRADALIEHLLLVGVVDVDAVLRGRGTR